jgi:hypothetical protein
MRTKAVLFALALIVGFGVMPSPARAGPGLIFGFSDDAPKWDAASAAASARSVGASAFRLTLHWGSGESDLTAQDISDLDKAVAGTNGFRLVLSVYGSPTSAPQDDQSRTQFCAYVKNAVDRFPSITDVVVWNEPNVSSFWRPQFNPDGSSAAPVAYEALLARCFDVLHAFRPTINVVAPATSPRGNDNPNAVSNVSHSPVNFIERMGLAYRASGRSDPLFDTVGQHVYQNSFRERPFLIQYGRYRHRRRGLEQARPDARAGLRRHRPAGPRCELRHHLCTDLVPREWLPDDGPAGKGLLLHRHGGHPADPRLQRR